MISESAAKVAIHFSSQAGSDWRLLYRSSSDRARATCSCAAMRSSILSILCCKASVACQQKQRSCEDDHVKGGSLLRSEMIAPGEGEVGRTQRLCIMARGAIVWQSSPSAYAVNSPPGGGSSCQNAEPRLEQTHL